MLLAGPDGLKVLVTGGAGYIGSHLVVALAAQRHEPVLLDNFSNSKPAVLPRLERLCGRRLALHQVDLLDRPALLAAMRTALSDTAPEQAAVMHLAGLKAVAESVREPLRYYRQNVIGSLNLVACMAELGLARLVFSSSAAVYSQDAAMPLGEASVLQPSNPYGRTKLTTERLLRDLCAADENWSVALLRYFNPAGAHPSGLIGEDPQGVPNNLMPLLVRAADGRRELAVFGDDWPTRDGSCVRDYIHVCDLAEGHVAVLDWLRETSGWRAFNLGTGRGCSVLELVRAFEEVNGVRVRLRAAPRRPGDVATLYADPARASAELGWSASLGLEEICRDAWHWQSCHAQGPAERERKEAELSRPLSETGNAPRSRRRPARAEGPG